MNARKIIVITGPTASGKTALGVRLAQAVGGEIVSADSMQVYRYMDIGTAKPTEDEKLGVRHHMLDVVPPWEDYSVSRYVEDAAECVEDILGRGKRPIIVGGTGLYIDSLISGREFQERGDGGLRQRVAARYDESGGEVMLRELSVFDQVSAEKLHANDKKRIIRAFEVFESSGRTISEHDRETQELPPRYEAVKLALTFSDRADLYERIDRRVDMMLAAGLEDEVRRLLEMGAPPGCTAMQAIGYKEMAAAVRGECSAAAAAEKIKRESRRYAKRQITWLRRDSGVKWITWEKTPNLALGLEISTGYLSDDGYNESV